MDFKDNICSAVPADSAMAAVNKIKIQNFHKFGGEKRILRNLRILNDCTKVYFKSNEPFCNFLR